MNDLMAFILALFPIGLILFLMVGLRWSAARAGAAGYLSTLILAVVYFGAGAELLAYAHARALLLAIDVLLIIWAAFLLYRVVDEAGAIRIIGLALPLLTPDKALQALLIGWIFASFLQGVGGFGVPVAVTAPILIGLGFPPLTAVVVPSLGHGWAVTFGSMGSSFQALLAATGLTQDYLAATTALFLGISCPIIGWMIVHLVCGWDGVRRLFWLVLLWGFVMGGIQYLVVKAGFWFIGAFIGAMFGLAVAIPMALRYRHENYPQPVQTQPGSNPSGLSRPEPKSLIIALSGYAIVILVTLFFTIIPAVKESLSGITLTLHFPQVVTRSGFVTPEGTGRTIVLLQHTGMVLVYSAILAYLVYRWAGCYNPGSIKRILSGTIRRVMGSSVSIFSMVTMAVIMETTGMTDTLAKGLARGTGGFYPFFASWIGALGAFITGSNTNSNVVFGGLQMRTAEYLGYSLAVILAAQTAGAALASVVAPTKVVVGASTASMAGKEGEIMRKLLVYVIPLVFIIGLLTVAAIWYSRRL